MYIAVYDANGIISKCLQGPDLEWASAFVAEEYGDDFMFLEADHVIDNATMRVDLTVNPPVIVPFTPTKTPEQIKAEILAATQQRLDEFAQTRNYDGILSSATYATSAVAQFAAEGQRAIELRDETWATLYQMLAEVQAGTRTMPAGYADIEAELPELSWPA